MENEQREEISIKINHTYIDGNNIIWDDVDASPPPTQIMEGTLALTNGKGQIRRYMRDGRFWNNGAPKYDDPRNLVQCLDPSPNEYAPQQPEENAPELLPNPIKSRPTGFSKTRYQELLEETFEIVRLLSKNKGEEYAGDDDRLANFRQNGQYLDLPMETIWRVYAVKHWDAIGQYIVDIQKGKSRYRSESISGRADDLITYLLLFKAMIEEREQ